MPHEPQPCDIDSLLDGLHGQVVAQPGFHLELDAGRPHRLQRRGRGAVGEHGRDLVHARDRVLSAGAELGVVDQEDGLDGLRDHRALDLGLELVGVREHAVAGDALDAQEQAVGEMAEHGVDRVRADERARERAQRPADRHELDVRRLARGDRLHHREAVGDHRDAEAQLDDPAGDEVGGARGVQKDRLARGEHRHGLVGEPGLGLGGDLDARGEGVFLRGDRRQHGAAMRPARDPLALQLHQVAAGGNRRDAEARFDLGDGDGAGVAQKVGDGRPADNGQHRSV
jgi:hypothetical protein